MLQLLGQFLGIQVTTYGACNIVTAEYVIDDGIVGSMLTVDIDEGITAHIGHTGTAIDIMQVASLDGDAGVTLHLTLVAAAIDVTTNLRRSVLRHRLLSQSNNRAQES